MPKIFVSVINYNGEKNTLSCLKSLNESKVEDFELYVVVVDNASTEIFEVEKNEYNHLNLKIIRNEKNLGFSGGQNTGIKYALENQADYVVILNNDVILDTSCLLELYKTFSSKGDCGLVSPKIYFAKGYEFHKGRYGKEDLGKVIWYAGGKMDWDNVLGSHRGVDEVDKGQYDKEEETDFVSGCCMMVKREIFETIGFLDENYFLYYEDNDFNQKARRAGYKTYYQSKAFLWHLNAGSSGPGSVLHDYYISRNRLLFAFKFASFRTKAAIFKESIKILINGRKWQKTGVRDFYLKKFGKGSFVNE